MKGLTLQEIDDQRKLAQRKVIIFSIGSLFIIMPFKVNKIEVRIRNILINSKHRFEAIAKFIPVYLNAHEK